MNDNKRINRPKMKVNQKKSEYESPEEFMRSRRKSIWDYLDDREDLFLSREMQVISDSLGDCGISKQRPAGAATKASGRIYRRPSADAVLWAEEGREAVPRNVMVSHGTKDRGELRYLHRSRAPFGREALPRRSESSGSGERGWKSDDSRGEFPRRTPDPDAPRRTFAARTSAREEASPLGMIDAIRGELRVLGGMTPAAGGIIASLSDAFLHYETCGRCTDRISSSLPWILNRIQRLIEYVTRRRRKSHLCPDDRSYLRPSRHELFVGAAEEEQESLQRKVFLGKAEEVDALVSSGAWPGVQLLLEVKPERKRRRFFDKAKNEEFGASAAGKFPVLQPRNHSSAPLVQVLKPKSKLGVVWNLKREVVCLKAFAFALLELFGRRPQVAAVILEGRRVGRASEFRKAASVFYPRAVQACEVQSLQRRKSSWLALGKRDRREEDWKRGYLNLLPRERLTWTSKDFFSDAPKIVRDLIEEAEEEKMHLQRMNELEAEVKGLKDLMVEVHKNQVELSKVLLEKGVYSQPMIKLTDPGMLEEEAQALKTAAQMGMQRRRSSSVESLQVRVDHLKRKCSVKNRMIVTLLKGLRSSVPKEWWEELVDYMFDESRPIEEFDPEKVSEFIRQTSVFLLNGEKESRTEPWSPPRTELPSEEEPERRGIVGAEVEKDLKSLSRFHQPMAKTKNVVVAFPAVNGTSTEAAIRKLENQISLLNIENDRLWHQVNELRGLLQTSVKEMNEGFRVRLEPNRRAEAAAGAAEPSGETINLTIQVAKKDARRFKDGTSFKVLRVEDSSRGGSSRVSFANEVSFREEEEAEETDRKTNFFCEKNSSRRWTGSDLNRFSDESPTASDHEGLRELLRKMSEERRAVPEASDGRRGASFQRQGVEGLLQKPSVMELVRKRSSGPFAMMANERELQTIPENDNFDSGLPPSPPAGVVDRLRDKVRVAREEMGAMRSKNDRIDHLLDRLMEDVVENRESFEEVERSFGELRDRLG